MKLLCGRYIHHFLVFRFAEIRFPFVLCSNEPFKFGTVAFVRSMEIARQRRFIHATGVRIAHLLHHLHLSLCPQVERCGAHGSHVDANPTVYPSTMNADEYAEVRRGPSHA